MAYSPPERIVPKLALSPTESCCDPSTPSTGTAPTVDTSTSQQSGQSLASRRQIATFKIPLPSPSRARLDPQYAARLAQTPRSLTPRSQSSPSSTTPSLVPPPGIHRDSNVFIFRPSPILTQNVDGFQRANSTGSGPSPHQSSSPYYLQTPVSPSFIDSFTSWNQPSPIPRYSSRYASSDYGTSDRFVPSRATSNFNFNLWDNLAEFSDVTNSNTARDGQEPNSDADPVHDDSGDASVNNSRSSDTSAHSQSLLNVLLRSELLGENMDPTSQTAAGHMSSLRRSEQPLREGGNHFRFQSPRQMYQDNVFDDIVGPTAVVNSFSLTPIGSAASQRLMATPPKRKRRIARVPFKVLDAPALQDDFYLNLVDWSSQNVLAVGLGACVYLWSACTSKVTKLCDLAQTEDVVTSVSWAQRGTHLAVGTNRGEVQLWDSIKCKKVRTMTGHSARVGTLAWTGPVLASGSRDRNIFLRDVRLPNANAQKLSAHKQEVCGLKWSFDEPAFLASGGNDNQLHVVDSRNPTQVVHRFSDHSAAVKAIAWSPHQHGILASGGGTADRCIRFWNTLSGAGLNCVDTGSQVCNLAWSQNCNEIVSTHGYSLNQIVVWRYPSMSKVVTLTGHTYRVLYLAMSPDGSTIVTGAGDETLRFWQVFPGPRSDGKNSTGGLLFPNTPGSVIR